MNKFKVKNSAEKVSAFGGFNFIFNSFHQSGLFALIDRELGIRGKNGGFQYSDICQSSGCFFQRWRLYLRSRAASQRTYATDSQHECL